MRDYFVYYRGTNNGYIIKAKSHHEAKKICEQKYGEVYGGYVSRKARPSDYLLDRSDEHGS